MNTIITGATSDHLKWLRLLLQSVRQFHSAAQVELVVWDLGLTAEERKGIESEFATVVRVFDYSKYPEYYRITVNAGEYAWKPALIQETRKELGERTYLWLDAGDRIRQSLAPLFAWIEEKGFFSNTTHGTVGLWTHPKVFEAVEPRFTRYTPLRMRNGAIIGFNERLPWVRQLMDTYAQWAHTKAILAPEGSSRANHRQDQSCLSLLYWDFNTRHAFHTETPCYSIQIHTKYM